MNGGAVALGHPIGASGGRILGHDGARAAAQRRRARPRGDLLRRRPGRRAADRGLRLFQRRLNATGPRGTGPGTVPGHVPERRVRGQTIQQLFLHRRLRFAPMRIGLIAAVLLVLGVREGLRIACSCLPVDLVRDLPQADGAFVGTVLAASPRGQRRVGLPVPRRAGLRRRDRQPHRGRLGPRQRDVRTPAGRRRPHRAPARARRRDVAVEPLLAGRRGRVPRAHRRGRQQPAADQLGRDRRRLLRLWPSGRSSSSAGYGVTGPCGS